MKERYGTDDPIDVMLVDDHPALRFGMKALLESSGVIRVVAEAADTENASKALERVNPEIMLLDIQLADENGIESMKRFLKEKPDLKIIFLTAFDTDDLILQALSQGAYAFLPKREDSDRILDVIKRVRDGERVLSGHQTDVLLQGLNEKHHQEVVRNQIRLTRKETELLGYIAQGMTNALISETMFISVSTVKRMTNSIVTKLGAANKTSAAAIAVREGLI